jgi:DNA-binding NtrC family response regulator
MEEKLCKEPYHLILLDMMLPEGKSLDRIPELKRRFPYSEIVMMTAYADLEIAMEAVRLGAYDFFAKPIDLPRLELAVRNACKQAQSGQNQVMLEEMITEAKGYGNLAGESAEMMEIYRVIEEVAKNDCTVMITGETGTGKDLVAEQIHRRSTRSIRGMSTVHCSAIPRELLEMEIFGQGPEGGNPPRSGALATADESALFIDDIGEMPLDVQARLLRLLEQKPYLPAGESMEKEINTRLIVASRADLPAAIEAGLFREDLYYRLNTIHLHLPPLRERKGDITFLANLFLRQASKLYAKRFFDFQAGALEVMERYPWPGNVRQLINVVHGIVILHNKERVSVDLLPEKIRAGQPGADVLQFPVNNQPDSMVPLWQVERSYIEHALKVFNGNISKVSRSLEVSRATLYRKTKEYSLSTRESDDNEQVS